MLDLTKPLRFIHTHEEVEHLWFSKKDNKYLVIYRDKTLEIWWINKEDIDNYLENTPPPPVVKYINWYKDSNGVIFSGGAECYFNSKDAKRNACDTRIACTRIEFIEGQFDE